MKIVITPANGALINVRLKDGTTLDNEQVEAVEVEPFFTSRTGPGEVVKTEVLAGDDVLVDQFSLVASASSGKVTRKEHKTERVVPLIDSKKAKPKPATAKPE